MELWDGRAGMDQRLQFPGFHLRRLRLETTVPAQALREFLAEVMELRSSGHWATGWGQMFIQALEAQLLSWSLILCTWPHTSPRQRSPELTCYSSTPFLLPGPNPTPRVLESHCRAVLGRGPCAGSGGPLGQRNWWTPSYRPPPAREAISAPPRACPEGVKHQ